MSSNSLPAFASPSPARSQPASLETDATLAAFNDDDCQCILAAIDDEALTAAELHDRCGLARSTTYRKLELLGEAGLLEERIRLSPTGHYTSEYTRASEEVVVRIDDGGVSVDLVDRLGGPTARWQ